MNKIAKIWREGFEIRINWNLIFAFMSFWSWGFFGYFSKGSFGLVNNILITILVTLVFLYFLNAGLRDTGRSYKVTREAITVFCSYFFVLLVLSIQNLTNPINGDHLPYVQHAKAHSLFIVEKLALHIPYLQTLPFWFVSWIVELLICVTFISLWYITSKLHRYVTVAFFGVLFLLLRAVVMYQGGNPDPYPSFGLFPIWLSGILLPGTDFSYRFSDFVPFVIFITSIYFFVKPYFSKISAWSFGLLIGTIPVLWHVGTLVEFSVWTAIGWTVFLYWLIIDKEKKLFSTYTLIAILAVCSSIRVSGPAAILFVLGLLTLKWYKKEISLREAIKTISPCLILIPILVQNHYVGSPAAYDGIAYENIGVMENAPLIDRLYAAFTSGVFANATLNTFNLLYVAIVLLLPVLLLLTRKYIELVICIGLFIIAYCMFYSIDPWLWGNGRYQAEYVFPYLAISLFLLLRYVNNKRLQIVLIVIGVLFNMFSFYTIPDRNKGWYGRVNYFPEAKLRDAYSIQSEYPMDFKRALDEARYVGYEGHVYFPGYLYLFSILSNYSVKDVAREKDIMVAVGASMGTSTVEHINKNKNIRVVFIPMYPKDQDPIEGSVYLGLKKSGWVDWKDIYEPVYHQMTKALIRK